MENDPFTDYIEKGLAFESSFGAGGRDALAEKEEIAWRLHESGSVAGDVLLGHTLLTTRLSFARDDVEVVPLARRLLKEGFAVLEAKESKDAWEWYYLGICHGTGGGSRVDHAEAARCFAMAKEAGNAYAEFEEIWYAYLAGAPEIGTILRFRNYEGQRLREFAEASGNALALLALGPVRETGSYQHALRIYEIGLLLHRPQIGRASCRERVFCWV